MSPVSVLYREPKLLKVASLFRPPRCVDPRTSSLTPHKPFCTFIISFFGHCASGGIAPLSQLVVCVKLLPSCEMLFDPFLML